MTRAENQYKQQLEQWSGVVSQMNEQVLALRVLSSAPQPPSASSSTPVKATPSSPRPPQPPLFSTTTTNNAASSPAVSSRFARPSTFAPRTPYTPSSAAVGSTPSKQPSTTGRSAVFQTPQTPGTFKSPVFRPYSTPSAASPTPAGSTAPTAAAVGDQSSATFHRRYHTRPPSIAASSPNFYSSYKASQQPGSVAGATAASTHQATPGAAGSAAKVAPPSPSPSQVSSHNGTSVSLSEEDQAACMELLVSQTQLLEKAQSELSALEAKIRAVKAERKGLAR